MAHVIPLNELADKVGKELEPSEWLEISQDRIDQFAAATNDHQFIHVDKEKAAQTPFGGTIAHGYLSLSLISFFSYEAGIQPEGTVMGVNYGFDKVRFLSPVRAGKRVRAHFEILDIQAKDGNRFLIKQAISVEIEGEETPALVAEWLTMVVAG